MKKILILFAIMAIPFLGMADDINIVDNDIYYAFDFANLQNGARVIESTDGDGYAGDIVIPETITWMAIEIPVTSIGNSAFSGCSSLISIDIPSSVTSIGDNAFYSCTGLTSVTIPNRVTSIGSTSFANCYGLTSVIIPNSVINIGKYVFAGCYSVESLNIELGNTIYDSRDNCNAIIETASNTLVSGCKNTIIPNSVTSIGELAFAGCFGLTSIEIPNSVTHIGHDAFSGCSGLTSITCFAMVPPSLEEDVFNAVPRDIPLYVPASSIPLYQAAEQWNEFDIQPLLVEIAPISPDTTNLTWLPVDSAAMYQLHIYSNQTAFDTTLLILANPDNGGTRLQTAYLPSVSIALCWVMK